MVGGVRAAGETLQARGRGVLVEVQVVVLLLDGLLLGRERERITINIDIQRNVPTNYQPCTSPDFGIAAPRNVLDYGHKEG